MCDFHSYPRRSFKGSDGERSQSCVATIICKALRGTGRPYTKRVLPEHIVQGSPFSNEKLVKLLEGKKDGATGLIDAACAALGCIDPRTAKRHICIARAAVAAKLVAVTEVIAAYPDTTEGPTFLPGTDPFAILCILWDTFIESETERSGSFIACAIKPLLWLCPGLEAWNIFNRSCIPATVPP